MVCSLVIHHAATISPGYFAEDNDIFIPGRWMEVIDNYIENVFRQSETEAKRKKQAATLALYNQLSLAEKL